MQPIPLRHILVFTGIAAFIVAIMFGLTYAVSCLVALNSYKAIIVAGAFVVAFILVPIVVYRLIFSLFPLTTGVVEKGTAQELRKDIYLLFCLIFFNAHTRSRSIPVPLMKLIALMLGARIGSGSYFSGVIYDHFAITIGKNTICGEGTLIYAHVLEQDHYEFAPVSIGSNVTVGARAVIMPGAVIGDGAIIASGSVVRKNAHVPAGEIWGGVPAKHIRQVAQGERAASSSLPATAR